MLDVNYWPKWPKQAANTAAHTSRVGWQGWWPDRGNDPRYAPRAEAHQHISAGPAGTHTGDVWVSTDTSHTRRCDHQVLREGW